MQLGFIWVFPTQQRVEHEIQVNIAGRWALEVGSHFICTYIHILNALNRLA